MAQLAVAWVLQNDNVASAITGGSRPEQVKDNAAAAGKSLSSETLAGIDEALGDAVERDGTLVGSMSPEKRPHLMSWNWVRDRSRLSPGSTGLSTPKARPRPRPRSSPLTCSTPACGSQGRNRSGCACTSGTSSALPARCVRFPGAVARKAERRTWAQSRPDARDMTSRNACMIGDGCFIHARFRPTQSATERQPKMRKLSR